MRVTSGVLDTPDQSALLLTPADTAQASPSAGVKAYAYPSAVFPQLFLKNAAGRIICQDRLFAPNTFRASPLPGSTVVYYQGTAQNVTNGTATTRTPATTNTFTRFHRTGWASSASAGNNGTLQLLGILMPGSNAGGFELHFIFGAADAASVAQARMFAGLSGSSSLFLTNSNPSGWTNLIGVGTDSADSNLSLIYNDGSGSATKTDLGANFPGNTQSVDMYHLILNLLPDGTASYFLRRINTGDYTSGTISTDLPAAGTLLYPSFWRNNGTTAAAVAIDWAFFGGSAWYV